MPSVVLLTALGISSYGTRSVPTTIDVAKLGHCSPRRYPCELAGQGYNLVPATSYRLRQMRTRAGVFALSC